MNRIPFRRFRLLLTLLLPLVAAAALVIYTRWDPEESVLFPKCMFYSITGLKCPGCGSQRAFHQLLNGDFAEAFRYNALAVASVPYLMMAAFLVPYRGKSWVLRSVREFLFRGMAVYIIIAVILAFWILRNALGF